MLVFQTTVHWVSGYCIINIIIIIVYRYIRILNRNHGNVYMYTLSILNRFVIELNCWLHICGAW